MSLSPSPLTFSHDRLRNVWREFQPMRRPFRRNQYEILGHDSNHNLQYPRAARQFCLKLYSSVQDPRNHLAELIKLFDSIDLRPFMKTTLSESVVSYLFRSRCSNACKMSYSGLYYLNANNLG